MRGSDVLVSKISLMSLCVSDGLIIPDSDLLLFLVAFVILLAQTPEFLDCVCIRHKLLPQLRRARAHLQKSTEAPVELLSGFQISLEAARQVVLEEVLNCSLLGPNQLEQK